jgi:hypothetical protein
MKNPININEWREPLGDDVLHESKIRELIQAKKKAARVPLTLTKVLGTAGLQDLSEEEAVEVVDTIKKLSALLFEMHCHKEAIFIDNQQVVSLTNEKIAA